MTRVVQSAIADARRTLARKLFGGTYPRELRTRWTVWYGLACLAFPAYLLATAAALWVDLLQRAGVVGLSIVLLGLSNLIPFVLARWLSAFGLPVLTVLGSAIVQHIFDTFLDVRKRF